MGIRNEAYHYGIRNFLPGTTCDINLLQITLFIHGRTTMLINTAEYFNYYKIVISCDG